MNIFMNEPLLEKDPYRKALFPIKYPILWSHYKKAEGSFWTMEEIDFSGDATDWKKLSEPEQRFIELILAFFAGADAIVNENLAENFLKDIDILECKCFYGFQIAIENIHNEVYSQLIETLIPDREKKLQLLGSLEHIPSIRKLYQWAQMWIKRTLTDEYSNSKYLQQLPNLHEAYRLAEIWAFAKRLVAFACVEGIMFSGPFATIFWIKEKGILKGTTFANEKISVDEGLHRDYACLVYSMIVHKPPIEEIVQIVREVVQYEQEFMSHALDRLVGINRNSMNQYIEFVADDLLMNLQYPKVWNTANPFPFMKKISFNGVTNFFERKVGEYSMAGFEQDIDYGVIRDLDEF